MMGNLFGFTQNWTGIEKRLFQILYWLTAICILPLVYYYFNGSTLVYPIDVHYEVTPLAHTIDSYQLLGITIPIKADSYLIEGFYSAGLIILPKVLGLICFAAVFIACGFLLTAITYFKQTAYYVSMLIFNALFVLMRLSILDIPIGNNVFQVLGLLAISGVSVVFFTIKPNISIQVRLLSFLLLMATIFTLGVFLSPLEKPEVILMQYGMILPVLLTIVYFVIASFDLPALVFQSITDDNQTKGRAAVINFSVFSIIYLGNLLVTYLHLSGKLNWDVLLLQPIILIVLTTLAGARSWKKRAVTYSGLFSFNSAGAILYQALAAISLITCVWAYANQNDSLIEMLESVFCIASLAFGTSFWFYIITNYVDINVKGKLHLTLYNEKYMNARTLHIMGLMGAILLYYMANGFATKQAQAAYYNTLGDAYLNIGSLEPAKAFYEQSKAYQYRNNRANFALASIAIYNKQFDGAYRFLKDALDRRPTVQSFLLMHELSMAESNPVLAAKYAREGRIALPDAKELWVNELHFAFLNNNPDTLEQALARTLNKVGENDELLNTNLLSYYTKQVAPELAEALIKSKGEQASQSFKANEAAFLSLRNEAAPSIANLSEIAADSSDMSVEQLVYLYNTSINRAFLLADTSAAPALMQLAKYKVNEGNLPFLWFAAGYAYYKGGDAANGLRILGEFEDIAGAEDSPITMFYAQLQQKEGAYLKALDNFEQHSKLTKSESFALKTFGAAYYPKFRENTLTDLALIEESGGDTNKVIAIKLQKVLRASIVSLEQMDDYERFLMVEMRANEMPIDIAFDWAASISNPTFKSAAYAKLIQMNGAKGNLEAAELLFTQAKSFKQVNKWATNLLDDTYLRALFFNKSVGKAKSFLADDKSNSLANQHKLKYAFLLKAFETKDVASAKKMEREWLSFLKAFPNDEFLILMAAEYYNYINEPQKSYDLLLTSLDFNPYHIALNRAYIQQCFKMNYTMFGEEALNQFRNFMPEGEFAEFANTL